MNIWLASADLRLLEKYLPLGIFSGVITNPKVVAEGNQPPVELFRKICQIADAAYYQLQDGSASEMMGEAEKMIAVDPKKMRIKVPATPAGFSIIRRLASNGHPVMATVVPTASWLVFALAAGARVVAPYGSMLQRRGIAAKSEEVVKMQRIIDAQGGATELCVGIYDITEFSFYAASGIRSCFVWGRDVESFLDQPLVNEAVNGFRSDWNKIRALGA